jgi:hypothetical protein
MDYTRWKGRLKPTGEIENARKKFATFTWKDTSKEPQGKCKRMRMHKNYSEEILESVDLEGISTSTYSAP